MKLNRNQLKYLAIIAMVIDHVGWAFVKTTSPLGFVMHFIGRLTGPIMGFMLAEGYLHTRNVKKYAFRMFLFTLISWAPFSLFEMRKFPTFRVGVIFTLWLGLLAMWMWDKAKIHKAFKIIIIVIMCIVSVPVGDWPIFDILWPLFLFIYRDDPKKKWISFTTIIAFEVFAILGIAIAAKHPMAQLFQIGAFMVPPLLIWGYNGEPGSKHPFHKWFFYVFYPAHLLAIWAIGVYLVH
ncbi:MAG: hypothetical protein J6Z22_10545 [Lachnospiraceae bacterium]|nr:hypothetical protein [Lachnospiraceae bacterium]